MPEFILKDWHGKEQTFDKETIFVKNKDGDLLPFTHGTAEPLKVTENGTYEVPEGMCGYSPVTVAVPAPEIKLQEKTVTANGTYTADSGFDALGKVLVNVAASGGTVVAKTGTFNGNGGAVTFYHNLGVVPAMIYCFPTSGLYGTTHASGTFNMAVGMNQETANLLGASSDLQYGLIYNDFSKTWAQYTPDNPIDTTNTSSVLFRNATTSSITIGDSSHPSKSDTNFTWYAVGIKKG